MRTAAKKAIKEAADEGVELTPDWSMRHLDYMTRALRNRAVKAQLSNPPEARRLNALHREISDVVETHNPALKEARRIWSGGKADEEALELGRKLFTENADFNVQRFRDMSRSERTHFRVAIMEELRKRLGSKARTQDISKEFRTKPNLELAVRAAFGSRARFNKVMADLADEGRMHETFIQATKAVTPTERAANNELGGALGVVAGTRLGNLVGANELLIAGAGRRMGSALPSPTSGFQQQVNRELSPLLMQGAGSVESLLRPPRGLESTLLPRGIGASVPISGLLSGREQR